MIPINYYYVLASLIFCLGSLGVLFRKNIILTLMSIELILNAVNIVFIAGSRHNGNLDGQIMAIFVMTVAACEAAVGLAMVIAIFRNYGTTKTDFLRMLRG